MRAGEVQGGWTRLTQTVCHLVGQTIQNGFPNPNMTCSDVVLILYMGCCNGAQMVLGCPQTPQLKVFNF